MLVLTRRVGESVVIHDDVYCTILGFWGDEIRLAFDAPKSIPINRDEIQRRIFSAHQNVQCLPDKSSNKESVVDRLISKFKYGVNPA